MNKLGKDSLFGTKSIIAVGAAIIISLSVFMSPLPATAASEYRECQISYPPTNKCSDEAIDHYINQLLQDIHRPYSVKKSDYRAFLTACGEKAIPALITLLHSKNEETIIAATNILANMGSDVAEAVPELGRIVSQGTKKTATNAANALGRLGPVAESAIPFLISTLSRPEPPFPPRKNGRRSLSLKESTMTALKRIGPPTIPYLIPLLSKRYDKKLRVRAALILGKIGPEAQEAIPYICPLLQSKNKRTQLLAAIVLTELGADTRKNLPLLISALQVQEKEVLARVTSAVGTFGEYAAPAVPDLIRIVGKYGFRKRGIGRNATKALVNIGSEAVPYLILSLRHQDDNIAQMSSFALKEIGIDAVPALIQALRVNDTDARRQAASILGEIGLDAIPYLMAALLDEDFHVRHGAIYALSIINCSSYDMVNIFNQLVENESNILEERRIAASALELMGQGVSWFFIQHNFTNPKNAVCPSSHDPTIKYSFDIFTGKCLAQKKRKIKKAASIGEIWDGLTDYFSGGDSDDEEYEAEEEDESGW